MREPTSLPGVTVIPMPGALAAFADLTASPPAGADERALAEAAGEAARVLLGHAVAVLYSWQVHGPLTHLFEAARPLPPGPHFVGDCDGLISTERGVALQVRSADCLPVALAGGGVAAMLHAGWRGLGADILGRAVARIEGELGVAPRELHAVVGVGVRACHYPVGHEVVAALARHPVVGDAGWHRDGRVDLATWAVGRLCALGLDPGGVRALPGCTACLASHHSFRRDGDRAGRQWSAVVLTPG